jgi:hypothetical protein
MNIVLPLSEMTTSEKMALIETIWEDIGKNSEEPESPSWHGEVLEERERRIAAGEETFLTWEEAEKQLRRRFE